MPLTPPMHSFSVCSRHNKRCRYNGKELACNQDVKISEIQTNQRKFFLTFGPVIRKLFTDLEERKTTEHNGDAPAHFCCQESVRITSEDRIYKKKGKPCLPRKNYATYLMKKEYVQKELVVCFLWIFKIPNTQNVGSRVWSLSCHGQEELALTHYCVPDALLSVFYRLIFLNPSYQGHHYPYFLNRESEPQKVCMVTRLISN